MSIRRAGATAVVGVVALTILHACVVANGLLVPQKDASIPPDTAPPDPCNHARIPTPPGPEARGEGVVAVFALSAVDFGADAGAAGVGFDLDDVCTCFEAGPESCTPRAKTVPHCDGDDGRDNGMTKMANLTATGGPSFDTYINGILREGRGGLLMVLDKYNGEANDDAVTLGFLPSHGKYQLVDGGMDGAFEYVDADTTKRWSIDLDSYIVEGSRTPRRFAPGYVRDGTLVVRMNDNGIPLVGLDLELADAYLVAPLDRTDPMKPRIERGTIVGRWGIENMAAAAGRFVVSLSQGDGGKPLCEQPLVYEGIIKPGICQGADISLDPKKDNTGSPCDALSVAMGFRAEPAEIGDFVPVDKASDCPDATAELICPQ